MNFFIFINLFLIFFFIHQILISIIIYLNLIIFYNYQKQYKPTILFVKNIIYDIMIVFLHQKLINLRHF